MREASDLVFETLGLPVGGLFGGLERGVFTDSSISGGEDLLDILRADAIFEVSCELLLEASEMIGMCLINRGHKSVGKRTAHHLPPQETPCTQQYGHQRCTS